MSIPVPYANIARAQSRRFFWPGAEREDVEQEALLALVEARPTSPALAKTIIRRRLIERAFCGKHRDQRRQSWSPLDPRMPAPDNLVELVDARWWLREVARASLSDLEREAIRRAAIGQPIGRSERSLDNALQRARRKLAA